MKEQIISVKKLVKSFESSRKMQTIYDEKEVSNELDLIFDGIVNMISKGDGK